MFPYSLLQHNDNELRFIIVFMIPEFFPILPRLFNHLEIHACRPEELDKRYTSRVSNLLSCFSFCVPNAETLDNNSSKPLFSFPYRTKHLSSVLSAAAKLIENDAIRTTCSIILSILCIELLRIGKHIER